MNPVHSAAVAEFAGTAMLLAAVVGSGIMAGDIATGNSVIALLSNSIATGAGLYVLISILRPISGAHFNPAVTITAFFVGEITARRFTSYLAAQTLGGMTGVWIAHAMFAMPILQASMKTRTGISQWLSEIVATVMLLVTIRLGSRYANDKVALLVASVVISGYWFTASTFFGNPAATLARTMTDTFAGIWYWDAGGFIIAQMVAVVLVVGAEQIAAHNYNSYSSLPWRSRS